MFFNIYVMQVITEVSILATELNFFFLISEFSKSSCLLPRALAWAHKHLIKTAGFFVRFFLHSLSRLFQPSEFVLVLPSLHNFHVLLV